MGLYSDKLWASVKVIEDYNQLIEEQGMGKIVDAGKFVGKLQTYGGLADELLRQCTWEDLENCGLPRLLSRKVAKIFRSSSVEAKLLPSQQQKDEYRDAVKGNPSWQSKGDTGVPKKKRPGIL